ncbi:MAG: hypothetical protein KDB26_13860 [Microthrixaceae bacterium]|nr:hypothetical protein [Microthrixaceae bacterium]
MSALAAVSALLVLSGCGTSTVEGTPATDAAPTTSDLVPLISPDQTLEPAPALNVNGVPVVVEMESPVNQVVVKAAEDVTEFWANKLPTEFNLPKGYAALPASSSKTECYAKLDFARFCQGEMIWEVPQMEAVQAKGGDGSVLVVVGHEIGHRVQSSTGISKGGERNADCLSGVYLASVRDGKSSRFKGNDERIRFAANNAFKTIQYGDETIVRERMAAFADGLRLGSVEQCSALHP